MRSRRGRESELRTRTGCNRCRLRRVKCPEQKPACKPCQALGFQCSYEKQLRWQPVTHREANVRPQDLLPLQHVEKWMFLPASPPDFDPNRALQLFPEYDCEEDSSTASDEETESSSQTRKIVRRLALPELSAPSVDIFPGLSSLQLTSSESHLWSYFHRAIAPSCVLDQDLNPYQDVILRIAASTGNTSPLFHSIMAISASQLYILGKQEFYSPSWIYRQKALRSLRLQTTMMEQGPVDQSLEAQILATVMAMVFLDILSDCSASWVVHSNFARSQIHRLRENHASLDEDLEALLNFVGGYIVVHEVYAHTAWNADVTNTSFGPVTTMCDDSNLQTLTGCSTEFFQILADVNTLAADQARCSHYDYADPTLLASLENRRHALERQLHNCAPDVDFEEIEGKDIPEKEFTLEIKRLTGLLHLYSRIDHLGPCDASVSNLAARILRLVAVVPTRSNIILWPLFMVATLGLGPYCDEERAFILRKIDSLQREREMRYIKKARRIVTEVWKVRDFKEAETRMGWGILEQVAQMERISLL